VPFIPEQAARREKPTFSLELAQITRALEIAAETLTQR
jgi:pyrrolidone-carboxylate peptidase